MPFGDNKIGLGCDHLTRENNSIIDHAICKGVTFFDTAECYGKDHESEIALGEKIKKYKRKDLFIASKCGVSFEEKGICLNGSESYIKASCQASLKRLKTEYIDLYYLHRVDPERSFEDSIISLKNLVKEGKIKYIGLCEVTADQIRRAHKIHPISAVQIEYAPWSREDEQNDVIKTCKELGILVVAYSPLGRGLFTDADASYFSTLPKTDFRQLLPRYSGKCLNENLKAKFFLQAFAKTKKCTLAQLVLAWEIGKGLVPIPSTVKPQHLEENIGALSVKLSSDDIKELDKIISSCHFIGPRYPSPAISAIYPEKLKLNSESKHSHPSSDTSPKFMSRGCIVETFGLFKQCLGQKSSIPNQAYHTQTLGEKSSLEVKYKG